MFGGQHLETCDIFHGLSRATLRMWQQIKTKKQRTAQIIRSSITTVEPITWGRKCGNKSSQKMLFINISIFQLC